jgi:hypothetical protein
MDGTAVVDASALSAKPHRPVELRILAVSYSKEQITDIAVLRKFYGHTAPSEGFVVGIPIFGQNT